MRFTPIFYGPHPTVTGGMQARFRFANGYGASVICTPFSRGGPEGLLELAVLRFSGEQDDEWEVVYDTPLTDDVLGYLTPADVKALLQQTSELPAVLKLKGETP